MADVFLNYFGDINLHKLSRKTGKKIFSLILDVDSCIAPDGQEIPPENIKKMESLLRQKIKIGIYSNSHEDWRLEFLKKKGVKVYTGPISKPDKKGFLEACRIFKFNLKTTWMIGENPLTDGGAIGVLGGIIFVKPISDDLSKAKPLKRISRWIYRSLRSFAIWRMLILNRSILRNKDLK